MKIFKNSSCLEQTTTLEIFTKFQKISRPSCLRGHRRCRHHRRYLRFVQRTKFRQIFVVVFGWAIARCLSTTPHPMNRARG